MTRSRRRLAGPNSTLPRSSPRSSRNRLTIVLMLVAIAVIVAWIEISRRSVPPRLTLHASDSLDAQSAFAQGGRLGTAGRHVESIPYFRRATTAGMGEQWEGRINLAAALINAALEVDSRLGKADPALRSSYERVQSVVDGMGEARQAMRVARDSRARAYTAYQDAQNLQAWGFAWDALAVAQVAQSLDLTWEPPRRLILELQRDLARGGVAP